LTHIIDEYKQRFLQNTNFFIKRFHIENDIEFNNIIPNGATMPSHSEMRDQVILNVELESRDGSRPLYGELGDETFRLHQMQTHIEPLYPYELDRNRINNVYTFRLKYFIVKN
jgi:hypothetical protein